MFKIITFCCCSIVFQFIAAQVFTQPQVNTRYGTIYGKRLKLQPRDVDAFLGVPYATPPLGHLRFLKPLPVKPWKQPLQATKLQAACSQYMNEPIPWCDRRSGHSEDCLYLNIYAPVSLSSRQLAVMFWIHGGGYSCGSNRLEVYDGRTLATIGDVIVVTINYRMTSFGFLYSNSEDAPGNMGLYDTYQALLWVRENIGDFGGDKSSITVFGQSVGAVTAGIFAISPLTKGLYKRAILQSYAADYISEKSESTNLNSSQRLAKAVRCANDSFTIWDYPKEVVHCLRGKSADTLLRETLKMEHELHSQSLFLSQTTDTILPRNAVAKIKNGDFHDTELFIGVTTDEGSSETTDYPDIFGALGEKRPKLNKTFAMDFLRNNRHVDDHVIHHCFSDLEEYDFNEIKRRFFELLSNLDITCVSIFFAESFSRKNNVYFYVFAHRPSNSPWDPYLGVAHFDETAFAFGEPIRRPGDYQRNEVVLSRRMLNLWVSFAKYGFPDKNWPRFTKQQPLVRILNTTCPGPQVVAPQSQHCLYLKPYINV